MPLQIVVSNAIGAFQGLVGGGPGPGPGPLPSDFAAGYSVRKLSSSYSGSALRVRRTVAPFDEQDIGFDSNGDLDTAAIATFGGSDPLTVSRWYDQSGNLFDVTQGTATAQPTIFDGTAVITVNGKPAVSFDGNDVLRYTGITNTDLVTDNGHASSVVFKDTSASGFRGVVGTDDRAIDFVTRLGNTDWQYSITTNNTPELQYTASASNYNVQNLSFVNKGASNAYWRLNASQIASALGGGVVTPGTTNWELGESVGLKYQGLLQEVVVWNTDNDSNAAGIESNINTYYSIYPTSGFLADYPGAAAAYSVRQLSNLATLALQVRRTSDNATQDIGFDSNGDLDTAAIAAFCGASPGTVSVWYDQSGRSNDAVQTTPASQPTIYDGAAVITENGVPSLDFDGSDDYLQHDFPIGNAQQLWQEDWAMFCTAAIDVLGPVYTMQQSASATTRFAQMYRSTNIWFRANPSPNVTIVPTSTPVAGHHLLTVTSEYTSTSDRDYTAYVDGTQEGTVNDTATYDNNSGGNNYYNRLLIGNQFVSQYLNGRMQELVLYPNDQVANRTGIESNINGYFNVYTEYNPDAPTSGFLFDYSGAAVAYSVRQLNDNATYAMRVRRTVAPFDEQDIGFDGSGNLDTSAISTFGGSDSLTVSRWYDQTGNQNHATQVNVQQPSIYDGTAVITNNGTPILDFNFSGFEFASQTFSGEFMLVTARTHYGYRYVGGSSVNPPNNGYRDVANNSALALNNSSEVTYPGTNTSAVKLDVLYRNSSNLVSLNVDGTANSSTHTLSGDFVVDLIGGGGGNFNSAQQNFHEFILYSNSNNIAGIESNINTYYSIY